MVSPELIRRYPFFSGLTMDQIVVLAQAAEEITAPADHYFHQEGDEVAAFYVIVEGEIHLTSVLPQKGREVILSTLGTGDVFGWSALLHPHSATAGAKTVIPSRLIAFDCKELLNAFEGDPKFGYVMMQKIARLVRERLNDLRIETMAYYAG